MVTISYLWKSSIISKLNTRPIVHSTRTTREQLFSAGKVQIQNMIFQSFILVTGKGVQAIRKF